MMLAAWTRDGLTQEQVAIKIGINIATLYKWRKKYKKIGEALKKRVIWQTPK